MQSENVLAAADRSAQSRSGAAVCRRAARDATDFEARRGRQEQFAGIELPHRTLGIIGLGAIGALVADTR